MSQPSKLIEAKFGFSPRFTASFARSFMAFSWLTFTRLLRSQLAAESTPKITDADVKIPTN
jgi:hypothetical protein